jgi:hypothetical protein
MKNVLLILIILILSFPAFGLAEDELVFIVLEGDTARIVTEQYLVRPTAWNLVVQYNYILKPGNRIRVPAELIEPDEKAFISSVFGDVQVKSSDSREWVKAMDGLILRKGDVVQTGSDSGVVLNMGRDDEVVLRSSTEVVFDPYSKLLSGKANRVNINSGTVLVSTRKRDDREARFEIRTPDSELELTGTLIRAKVDSDGKTQFEVLHGETVIKSGGREVVVYGESGIFVGEKE